MKERREFQIPDSWCLLVFFHVQIIIISCGSTVICGGFKYDITQSEHPEFFGGKRGFSNKVIYIMQSNQSVKYVM